MHTGRTALTAWRKGGAGARPPEESEVPHREPAAGDVCGGVRGAAPGGPHRAPLRRASPGAGVRQPCLQVRPAAQIQLPCLAGSRSWPVQSVLLKTSEARIHFIINILKHCHRRMAARCISIWRSSTQYVQCILSYTASYNIMKLNTHMLIL